MTRFIDRRLFLELLAAAAVPLAAPRRAAAQAAASGQDVHLQDGGRLRDPGRRREWGGSRAEAGRHLDSRRRPDHRLAHGYPQLHSRAAQSDGYAVVSIDYRLAPNTKLPAIIEDIQDAHRWVRAEGPKSFGADPNRIVVAGGSAGGYLTLMSGFCFDPRPKALVAFYGYGDITSEWLSRPDPFYVKQPAVPRDEAYAGVSGPPVAGSTPATSKNRGRFYLYCRQQGIWPKEVAGHDPDTENDWFNAYCPVRNVTGNYPPTLLIHGTADTDVPYQRSADMAAKLAAAGVEHKLITVPGAGHGLSGIDPALVRRVNQQAVEFIKAHRD